MINVWRMLPLWDEKDDDILLRGSILSCTFEKFSIVWYDKERK